MYSSPNSNAINDNLSPSKSPSKINREVSYNQDEVQIVNICKALSKLIIYLAPTKQQMQMQQLMMNN